MEKDNPFNIITHINGKPIEKKKKFYVSWDERHSIIVSAKDEEEALEIVKSGELNPKDTEAEYEGNEYVEEWGK